MTRNAVRTAVGCLLLLAGLGPLAYFCWEGTQAQPLSVPVTLHEGEYVSPYFKTYLGGAYQVDLDWYRAFPDPNAYLDLDWKIEDSRGRAIRQGSYSGRLRGANEVHLAFYQAPFGLRQRLVMDIHRDIEGDSANATLEVGQPEIGLDLSYGFPLLFGWAALAGFAGAIVLLTALIRRKRHRNAPAA